VHGAEYLNILKAISGQRFQIGNNRGGINGWIGANGIFGRLKTLRYFVFHGSIGVIRVDGRQTRVSAL
jgi:hypothetical protein